MDGAGYIADRVDPQIKYFERAATRAKRWHQVSAITMGSVAVAVPVVEVLPLNTTLQRVLTAILGASVAIIQIVRTVKRWHEDWLLFRSTEETLKAEKVCYLTKTGAYAGEDRDSVLVTTIEKVLSTSHGTFTETHKVTEGRNERGTSSHRAS